MTPTTKKAALAKGTTLEEKVTKAIEEANSETPVAAAPVEDGKPVSTGKKAEPFKTLGEKDEFGFGNETETSWLLAKISKGQMTKTELLQAFLKKFCPDESKIDAKRKKTSFSVFFSDVKRPFGTYHASRSLIINEGPGGKLVLEPKRAAEVRKAISAGILNDLRGLTPKKHAEKIKVVLKKYNMPQDPPKEQVAA